MCCLEGRSTVRSREMAFRQPVPGGNASRSRTVARSDTTGKHSQKEGILEGCKRAEIQRRRRTFLREDARLAPLAGVRHSECMRANVACEFCHLPPLPKRKSNFFRRVHGVASTRAESTPESPGPAPRRECNMEAPLRFGAGTASVGRFKRGFQRQGNGLRKDAPLGLYF